MDICKNYVELHDKIKDIRVAMLTTEDVMGCLRSMPMLTMKTECEGNVWFFTSLETSKVDEIKRNRCINLSYSDVAKDLYVSISGKAEIVTSRNKIEEMWKPYLSEWFPNGLNDDNLALLKVHMEHAEYWDAQHKKMIKIWDLSKAVVV
jgi:general stress protein 26